MSRSRFGAGCFVLAAWLGGGAFVACGSFGSDDTRAGDEGGAESGAGNEASPVEAGGDGAQAPSCAALDTTCDPLNCGQAGHSCLGGACTEGRCQPVVLTTLMATFVVPPVVDSTRVLVITGGGTFARAQWCAKTGCDAGASAADLPTYPSSLRSLVTDGTNAYVGTVGGQNAGVFRIDQQGTVTPITPTDGTFQYADDLAMDGPDVLFVSAYQVGAIGIYRVQSDGGAPATEIVPIVSSDRWSSLAVTPGRIFVADFQSISTCAGPSCAVLTQYAGPAVTQLDITRLVTNGTFLYWTSDQQKLLTCAVGGTCMASTQLVGSTELQGSIPIDLSIHGPDLFITTEAGKIFRCAAADCKNTFQLVATDEVVAGAAAADDAAVYWVGRARIDAGGGVQAFRLMRIAK